MRVIKPAALRSYWLVHADAKAWLNNWLRLVQQASWQNINDVRLTFRSADAATVNSGSTVTIFNVKGNKYRLIVAIHYNTQRVYIRDFMTHTEYDSMKWKDRH